MIYLIDLPELHIIPDAVLICQADELALIMATSARSVLSIANCIALSHDRKTTVDLFVALYVSRLYAIKCQISAEADSR